MVSREYEQMVERMDKVARNVDRMRAASGPSAKQLAEHEREMQDLRRRIAARKDGKR